MSNFFKRPLFRCVTILLSILLLISCNEQAPTEESDDVSNYHHFVNIQTAERQSSYQVKKRYLGKVISKQHTSLAFEFSGRTTKINADNGETVSKGQILAELNTELLTIKKRELTAKLQQLSAERVLNKKQLQRINSLNIQGYSSAQQKDILTSQQAVIRATIDQIKANQQVLDYQIDNALLRAPFDGVIIARHINEGEFINPQKKVFTLIKSSDVEFRVGIPADDTVQLFTDQLIDIEINNKRYHSTILTIAKHIDPITRTLELRVKVNDLGVMLDDQIGYLILNQEINRAGFWLPLTALTDGIRGQWNIYRAHKVDNSKQLITSQTVQVEYTTDSHAFITGVTDDEFNYIENGLHRLVPNQYVVSSNNYNKNPVQGSNQ